MEDLLKKISKGNAGICQIRDEFDLKKIDGSNVTVRSCDISEALDQFMECVRYLNTRRSKGTVINIKSEDDVQDALYIMLRPWVKDIKHEDPTSKSANRFVIKDFFIPSLKMIIEAKYVRNKQHGRDISKELHDDIEMYRNAQNCQEIIFFIYDPDGLIPSVGGLKKSICISRIYDGKPLEVKVIVKP